MRRVIRAFIIIGVSLVAGWQYALLRDFPMAEAISDIIPSPDQQAYATIIHYRSRLPFRPVREYVAIEIGRGVFDEHPEIRACIERTATAGETVSDAGRRKPLAVFQIPLAPASCY